MAAMVPSAADTDHRRCMLLCRVRVQELIKKKELELFSGGCGAVLPGFDS